MISSFSGINTVTLALQAQQAAQDTTGHNVSNANTPGYSRQTANLATMPSLTLYQGGGPFQMGTGVNVASVTRARDAFVDVQYRQQNASKSFWQSQTDTLSQVESIFTDTNDDGLQKAINNFYSSLQTLAANADDVGARTNVRESANSLVQVIQQDAQHLRDIQNDLSNQIATQVSDINNIAQQIADLNKQVVAQEANGSSANDLRDQRDLLVDKLSAITNVQTSEDKTGALSVSLAGVTLVGGITTEPLKVNIGNNGTYNYETSTVTTANGLSGVLNFNSGTLGSLFQLRDQTVVSYMDKLNNVSQFLMQDFNTQHKAGKDNNGTTPADNFFGVSGTNYTLAANTPVNSDWIDALKVNSVFYSSSGLNLIAASGAAAAGTADGSNALAMSDVLYQASAAAPTNALANASLKDYYNSMIGTLGVQSQQAKNMNDNQGVLLTSTTNWRESVSGVSTDEEMSNMIRFQKAYASAANVLSTMNQMLDTLINHTG